MVVMNVLNLMEVGLVLKINKGLNVCWDVPDDDTNYFLGGTFL